jgi:tetratricopeptide (TPR) repeat protein
MIRFTCVLLIGLMLGGCSSAPPISRPAIEEAAIGWNQRGQDAWRRGAFDEALAAYLEAYRTYVAMDRTEAAAGELLNLAVVRYRLGQHDAARRDLDQVLAMGDRVPAALRADAAYRRAHIELDVSSIALASEWLEKSAAWCQESCAVAGRVQNLRARIALQQGNVALAETAARQALTLNRGRKDGMEEANAHRLLAQIAAARKDYGLAHANYSQALVLDRVAAEPHKILVDLLGLAQSALAQNHYETALEFAHRARAAAESLGSVDARREADEVIASANGRNAKK